MAKEKEEISLVLTLFKGENFVCKKSQGLRCQIEAKCAEQVLHSGIFLISSTNSEPVFNFQLAWQFTRRALRELRGNKAAVKVRCLILNDDNKNVTELGYSVLHVQDALSCADGEVEASKARTYPLLGTKEQWKNYHPKLLMQLHIEDLVNTNSNVQRKETTPSPLKSSKTVPADNKKLRFENIDQIDKTPRVDVIPDVTNTVDKFNWQISEHDGCFQLGQPVDGDDLYIFNITLVSVSNLHLLWNGRSPKKPAHDDYIWQIRYKAYGCEIKSDPFTLSQGDSTRRTFIGDKATARIRGCAPNFCDYLQETAVDFHVVRFQLSPTQDLCNEEIMGICFGELKDLAQSDVPEIRLTMDVVSEWGYQNTIIPSEKPEIRAVFQLEATPAFFKSAQPLVNPIACNDDVGVNENQMIDSSNNSNSDSQPPPPPIPPLPHTSLITKSKPYSENDVRDFINYKYKAVGVAEKQKTHQSDVVDFGDDNDDDDDDTESHPIAKPDNHKRTSTTTTITTTTTTNNNNNSDTSQGFSFPKKLTDLPNDLLADSSCSSDSYKENSQINLPEPGSYIINISLIKIWLKSKIPIMADVILSYVHPKYKINEPVICTATPSDSQSSRPNYRGLDIINGENTIQVQFDKFSDKIINEPLTVELRMKLEHKLEPIFAFGMIPIGSVLMQPDKRGRRVLVGSADVLRIGTNLRVGLLKYHIDFESTNRHHSVSSSPSKKLKESNKINLSPLKNVGKRGKNVYVPPEMVFHTTEDLRVWQAEKKEEYNRELKEKERAYLKILAQEAAARDSQREKLITEKLTDLTKKEKELRRLSNGIGEREEHIKRKELELLELSQKVNFDNATTLENTKLSIRRMQEEHKIEISSLRRRNQEYEAELKKCKGKLDILEIKLEEKEDYINKLKTERYERPDSKLSEKLKLLEQENKLLKKQIADVEHSREQYKKQSQTLCLKLARLQDDRDRQLQAENENLREQIVASKQYKEIKKERKAVSDLSQQIKTLQDNKSGKPEGAVGGKRKSDQPPEVVSLDAPVMQSNDDEIQRLISMRSGLLHTGAYTQYDDVIKQMQKRITGLGEGRIDAT